MTRDYAKKKKTPYNSSNRGKKAQLGIPAWFWLMLGLSMGLSFAVFGFWKWGQQLQAKPKSAIVITEKRTTAKPKTVAANDTKSRFDFYTLLPNLKVELPDVEAPPSTRAQAVTDKTTNSIAYIIQAGSFKTHPQAEKLKAQLALSGVESQIQNVNIPPNEVWYRVYVGPFKVKEDAVVIQKNLQQTKVANALILKIQV